MKNQLKNYESDESKLEILNSILMKELGKKAPHRLPDFVPPPKKSRLGFRISEIRILDPKFGSSDTSGEINPTESHFRFGNSQQNCDDEKCKTEFQKLKKENASLKNQLKNTEHDRSKLEQFNSNLLKELASFRDINQANAAKLKTNSKQNFSEKSAQNQHHMEFAHLEIKEENENFEIKNEEDFDFTAHDMEEKFEIKNEFDFAHAQLNH